MQTQTQTIYRNALPTSLQPQAPTGWVAGWGANDRTVIYIGNNQAEEIREGTLRLQGILNLSKIVNGSYKALEESDILQMDSASGVNSFIRSLITEIDFGKGLENVEFLNEVGRLVHDVNQLSYMDGDMMGMNDSLQENMTGSNDQYVPASLATADYKSVLPLGMKFGNVPKNTDQSDVASLIPFSIDVKSCANTATLPGNKIKAVQFSINWMDAFKSGVRCFSNGGAIQFDYKVSNVDVRYIADPLQHTGDVVLKVIDNCSTPYILNKYSGLSFSIAKNAHAVFATFLKNDHNSTATNLSWNYVESEAIPKFESVELKVNGMPDAWQYPLTQLNQVLYNYLLAVHEGQLPTKHALTYSKLSNDLPSGFGIGAMLTKEYPGGTNITFNVVLDDSLQAGQSYRVFFYSLGYLKV